MGFESFQVELRGGQATFHEANEVVRQLPHVRSDPDSLPMRGSTYFVIEDGRHIIELELRDSPVTLSCRFTLCHPPSVDAVFLDLVRELMTRLEMEVEIRDDVPPEHERPFSLHEFVEFSAVALNGIATRRREWIVEFGNVVMAATTSECFRQLILPRCQPGIAQPT